MERTITTIQEHARELNLTGLAGTVDLLLEEARKSEPSYSDFALTLLETEISCRRKAHLERRRKAANLPLLHDLDHYDSGVQNGISQVQLRQLRQLLWLDQNYNLILIGPSGTGKSYLAGGLCHEALKLGYHALFRTMDELIQTIRFKEVTTVAAREYKRLVHAHLLVIDDIMMFPIEKSVAVGLFQLINQMHEQTSFIITTNKNPKEWAEMLGDEVLATALLDRLLYKCEVIKLTGKSYRLEHRTTIFEQQQPAEGGATRKKKQLSLQKVVVDHPEMT